MTQMEMPLTDLGCIRKFRNDYAEVYTHDSKQTIICILNQEYVPIREFRSTFERITEIVKRGQYKKFIFDKRMLRTFHQPSMEWYFLEWKTQMLSHGLNKHRKLLPDLPWFVKAVDVARKPLLKKLPDAISAQLDIVYCDSLEEAFEV